MVKSIAIGLVVPEGMPLVSCAREIPQSQKNASILMFVSSMEAGRQKEDSNSVPTVTGLTFVMTTHPSYGISLRHIMHGPGKLQTSFVVSSDFQLKVAN